MATTCPACSRPLPDQSGVFTTVELVVQCRYREREPELHGRLVAALLAARRP